MTVTQCRTEIIHHKNHQAQEPPKALPGKILELQPLPNLLPFLQQEMRDVNTSPRSESELFHSMTCQGAATFVVQDQVSFLTT